MARVAAGLLDHVRECPADGGGGTDRSRNLRAELAGGSILLASLDTPVATTSQ